MATTLATFGDSETTMRFNEPYLTDGLNRKFYAHSAPGIYEGFRLATSGVALSVVVAADPVRADHVAVYQTSTGFSLTLRRTGGNFTLNLASFAGKTAVICLFATYAVGSITTAEIRAYELLPTDTFTSAPENAELVVLGTVTVPASGTIPFGNITHDRRRSAWMAAAPEATPWSPLLRNPGFEYGETAAAEVFAIADWTNRSDIAVNGVFRLGSTTVHSGFKSLEFNKTSTSASTATIIQFQEIAVTAGQLIRVTGFIFQLIAPTSGSYTLTLFWGDANSGATSSTAVTLSATGVDASFRSIDKTVSVPGGGVAVLKAVSIDVVNVTSATTGVAVVFDDFQVSLEMSSAVQLPGNQNQQLKQERLSAAIVEDSSSLSIGQLAALLRFDRTTPSGEGKLVIERKDQDYSGSNLPPAIALLGRLLLGDQLISTETKALLPRLSTPVAIAAGIDFTLIWEAVPAGLKGIRIYVGDLGNSTVAEPGMFATVNARYDGTLWHKDVIGTPSGAFLLNCTANDVFAVFSQISPDTWISADWVRRLLSSVTGDFSISGDIVHGVKTIIVYGNELIPIAPCQTTYENLTFTRSLAGVALNTVTFLHTRLKAGDRILTAVVSVADNSSGPTTVRAQLSLAGTLIASSTSTGSGANQDISFSGLPLSVGTESDADVIYLRVFSPAGSAVCNVNFATITYDHP